MLDGDPNGSLPPNPADPDGEYDGEVTVNPEGEAVLFEHAADGARTACNTTHVECDGSADALERTDDRVREEIAS